MLARRFDELAQSLRTRAHLAIRRRLKQIHPERIGQRMTKPRRFARAARAKNERTSRGKWEKSSYYFHFETQNGSSDSKIPIYRPNSYRYSTNDITAPSNPCTFGLADSIT